jgi:hypothetical protein
MAKLQGNLAVRRLGRPAIGHKAGAQPHGEVVAEPVGTCWPQAQAVAGVTQLTLHVAIDEREQRFLVLETGSQRLEAGIQRLGNVDNPLEAALADQEQPTLTEQTVRDEVMIAASSCANELADTRPGRQR